MVNQSNGRIHAVGVVDVCALVLLRSGLVLASILLSGCVSYRPEKMPTTPPRFELPLVAAPTPALPSIGPNIVDHRPSSDKVRDMHSLLITSCDYGVMTLEEKTGVTSGSAQLRNEMAAVQGDPWRGHEVEVRHYAVYLNQKRLLKGTVSEMYVGLIPSLMLNAGESCAEAQMHGGWYTGTEILNLLPPLIVEISVNVDGKVYKVRSVYSPHSLVDRKLRHASDDHEVEQAVTKANKLLVAKLGKTEAAATPPTNAQPSVDPDAGFINFPSSSGHH